MLVGVQDDGGFSQGAQVADDLGVGTLPQLVLARDRLLEVEVGHAAMGQGRATERKSTCDQSSEQEGLPWSIPVMSSRPSGPDTREINRQACLAFAGDRSNCSGLVSEVLTIARLHSG